MPFTPSSFSQRRYIASVAFFVVVSSSFYPAPDSVVEQHPLTRLCAYSLARFIPSSPSLRQPDSSVSLDRDKRPSRPPACPPTCLPALVFSRLCLCAPPPHSLSVCGSLCPFRSPVFPSSPAWRTPPPCCIIHRATSNELLYRRHDHEHEHEQTDPAAAARTSAGSRQAELRERHLQGARGVVVGNRRGGRGSGRGSGQAGGTGPREAEGRGRRGAGATGPPPHYRRVSRWCVSALGLVLVLALALLVLGVKC